MERCLGFKIRWMDLLLSLTMKLYREIISVKCKLSAKRLLRYYDSNLQHVILL